MTAPHQPKRDVYALTTAAAADHRNEGGVQDHRVLRLRGDGARRSRHALTSTTAARAATRPVRRDHRHALRGVSHHRLHDRPWPRQVRQPRALRRLTHHLFPRCSPLTRVWTREVPLSQ